MLDQSLQSQEYETLRQELLQAKRYVFERPLVIVGAGFVGLSAFEPNNAGAVALGLASLFLFNFMFTVNRLMSASRIVAYIQLKLEEGLFGPWVGWESSLRYYRKWLKTNPDEVKKKIDEEIDPDSVPDAMHHYPLIYWLHVAFMAGALVSVSFLTILKPSVVNGGSVLAVLAITVFFGLYSYQYPPQRISRLIERNRVIWSHVFEYMEKEKFKSETEKGDFA